MKAEGRLFEEALASLRKWRFLVIGGALWWCCHFLTLYQNDIVSLDPIVGFPDIIWLSCVLATLVVFVVLMFSPRLRRAYGGTRTYCGILLRYRRSSVLSSRRHRICFGVRWLASFGDGYRHRVRLVRMPSCPLQASRHSFALRRGARYRAAPFCGGEHS